MPEKLSIEQLKADIVAAKKRTLQEQFERVLSLVKVLRQECPWDRKQTPESLAHLLLEESYELVHAIDQHDEIELKKEIGDLFLHLSFQVLLSEERGTSADQRDDCRFRLRKIHGKTCSEERDKKAGTETCSKTGARGNSSSGGKAGTAGKTSGR